MKNLTKNKKLYIFGIGKHCKVCTDIAESCGINIGGYIFNGDDTEYLGKPVYKVVEDIPNYINQDYFIAIGLNSARERISTEYSNLNFINLIHSSSIISKYANIGNGNIFMPGTVVNAYATIGNQCIINTHAIIEHDCIVGNYCHISIKSGIAGAVKLSDNVFLGAGSTVRDDVKICSNVVVGVNGAVVKDIVKSGVYVGVPAKYLKDIE